ncbi:Serine carboxypeptidase-like 18 [Apostasia shenzhenica]|uniref:Serine carboxypeptidase-like 18 n=1 Tax=Apostasia shenzhenica TaxID=1088818 RepID=A0A2I0B9Z7_9ASPA|nr:Serine carboxypeptidase-like 18 [Apostasia shenzhenica]
MLLLLFFFFFFFFNIPHPNFTTSIAASAAIITHLPGFDGALPFHLETGYVTVDEEKGSEYFYYFVESERNPSEDPLLLWLIGGPYCSGFNAFASTFGPVRLFSDSNNSSSLPNLAYNPYAWTKISSIIFLDWPIGTGFAFSKNAEAYTSDDLLSSKQIYIFIKKWFEVYPHFVSNSFFVGGDSYGGKLVPVVVQEIVQGNEGCKQQLVNIKGFLMGNPIIQGQLNMKSQVTQAHRLGIISDELLMMIENNCAGNDYGHPDDAICSLNLRIFKEFLSEINEGNVVEPLCDKQPVRTKELVELNRFSMEYSTELIRMPSVTETMCAETPAVLADKWANNALTRKVLAIKEETVEKWLECRFDLNYTANIPSSAPSFCNLLARGYRALVYSGDHDLLSPYVGTLKWIKSLEFSKLEEWRSWHVGGQVAGYTVLFSNNLTFATVKGGSHTPADHLPMQCFAMFQRWISDEVL